MWGWGEDWEERAGRVRGEREREGKEGEERVGERRERRRREGEKRGRIHLKSFQNPASTILQMFEPADV